MIGFDRNRMKYNRFLLILIVSFMFFIGLGNAQNAQNQTVNETTVHPITGDLVFSIDKEIYTLGEPVQMTILPDGVFTSVVVLDEYDLAIVIEDTSFVPPNLGHYQIDALLYYNNHSKRFKVEFDVVSETKYVRKGKIQEEITQHSAEVGKPVKFTKRLAVDEKGSVVIETELPKGSTDVTVYRVESGTRIKLEEGMKVHVDEKTTLTLDGYNVRVVTGSVVSDVGFFGKLMGFFKGMLGITGKASSSDLEMVLEITEIIYGETEYEIIYHSPAPEKVEKTIDKFTKQITVFSDYNYTNILDIVSNYYNISTSDLLSKKRKKQYVFPRQIAMYILKDLYDLTYKKIGQIFNNRDHSTVIYSIEQISHDIQIDKDKKNDIEKLLIKCGKNR